MTPFLSVLTPTYRRPKRLAACLDSVAAQTLVAEIEHVVIPDHVGHGIAGMYAGVHRWAAALHGRYVILLSDDDALVAPDVVAKLKAFVEANGEPAVVVVRALKMGLDLPIGPHWPPIQGLIDLACLVVRRDVWTAHCGDYGARYEGDFDMASALHRAGHDAAYCDVLFAAGDTSLGAPEE